MRRYFAALPGSVDEIRRARSRPYHRERQGLLSIEGFSMGAGTIENPTDHSFTLYRFVDLESRLLEG